MWVQERDRSLGTRAARGVVSRHARNPHVIRPLGAQQRRVLSTFRDGWCLTRESRASRRRGSVDCRNRQRGMTVVPGRSCT